MELILPVKKIFMPQFERYEPLARDHTATIAFKACARLYFYKIVLGFTERLTPPYFKFGQAYHLFREHLENAFIAGKSENECFILGLTAAVNHMGKKDPPAGSKWDFLTLPRLIKSCEYAFKQWKKEKAQKKIIVLAVEQPFDVVMKDGKTRRGGKADQFVKWMGKHTGRDWKTSSKTPGWYDRTLDPNDQFTGYIWGLKKLSGQEVNQLIIDVMFNNKTSGPKIQPYLATRTSWQLDKWEEEQILLERQIDVSRAEDIWPMCEHSCAFCEFRSVCKKGTEASQAHQLKSEFKQLPWDYKNIDKRNEAA